MFIAEKRHKPKIAKMTVLWKTFYVNEGRRRFFRGSHKTNGRELSAFLCFSFPIEMIINFHFYAFTIFFRRLRPLVVKLS
jgi:hypothetical protein